MKKVSFDFSGDTALVTGATKGIGRATALALAESGCAIAATGRNRDELESLKAEVKNIGQRCEVYAADLSDARETIEMAKHFCGLLDPISVLVNNAGVSFPESLLDLEIDSWETTMSVNLRAPALVSKVVAAQMARHRSGSIVNVASLASVSGIPEHAAYCASKFGLHGLTKVMALELAAFNIRVNAVGPTVVLTPMGIQVWGEPAKGDPMKAKIPLGRFVEPREVVDAVLFLASASSAMTTGQLLLVDGGFTTQ